MIDRYHLRYFLAVVDRGNFSKAAAACNVSQPTLSVGIAKMEKTLGHSLFHRTNRRVELTEAGARLATHARAIEAGFAQAEHAVAGTPLVDRVRIGVLVTTPRAWIETFVQQHRWSGSTLQVEVVEGRERELQERIGRGRLDVALTIVRADTSAAEVLFSEGYSLAVGALHPLAGRTTISAEELAHEPMIVRRHCEALAETSRHFTARGVRPFFPARTTCDQRAIGYVSAGLGITVMPDCFTSPGIVRPALEGFASRRDIGLIYAPHVEDSGLRASPAIRSVVRAIETCRAG